METEEFNGRSRRSALLAIAFFLCALIVIVMFGIFNGTPVEEEESTVERNYDFKLMEEAETNLSTMETIREAVDNILSVTEEVRKQNELLVAENRRLRGLMNALFDEVNDFVKSQKRLLEMLAEAEEDDV